MKPISYKKPTKSIPIMVKKKNLKNLQYVWCQKKNVKPDK